MAYSRSRDLVALGANPNAEYHWNWHPELPRTALWGALITMGHMPLAEALLEAGANPTDGVSRTSPAAAATSPRSNCCTVRHGRERHPRRRAAAGLYPDLRGGSVRSAMAAGPWRRRQSAMGSRPRSTPPRRRETLGCGDGGAVAETWRRSRTPARRWLHAALAGGAPRQSRIAVSLLAHGATNELSPLDQSSPPPPAPIASPPMTSCASIPT